MFVTITRLVFLDIDGVLNQVGGNVSIDPACVARLNRLCGETGAKIVVSSSWRLDVHDNLTTEEAFIADLHAQGIEAEIIGITPDLWVRTETESFRHPRALEIQAWIDNNIHNEWLSVVVLDDHSEDFPDAHPLTGRLITTASAVGLTEDDVDRAEWVLWGHEVWVSG